MREHCRSQHNYDPMPTNSTSPSLRPELGANRRLGIPSISGKNGTGQPVADERFMKMIHQLLEIQEFVMDPSASQAFHNSLRSAEPALTYMLDNFVVLNKKDIAGISGYVCNNCLAFQFLYIKDIGIDLTAGERHQCLPAAVVEASNLRDRRTTISKIYVKAIDHLVTLTNSIFRGNKSLVVDSTYRPEYFMMNVPKTEGLGTSDKFKPFHAHVIRLESVTTNHWVWNLILRKNVLLTDTDLENFVSQMMGTYCLISVKMGLLSGYHLMYIKNDNLS